MPQNRTRKIVVTAVLSAVTIVLGLLPFGGYIPFFGISITILAIPVIIGAILEGPVVGAGIGLIFGLTSLYQAATAPKSPLDPLFVNPLLSVLPRMLIGPVAWLVWSALKRWKVIGLLAAGFFGSYANTAFVLGMFGLLFAKDTRVTEVLGDNVWKALGGIALASGAPEAGVAAVVVLIVIAAYWQFSVGKKKGSDL
jgi:uncharacterized membrane protein